MSAREREICVRLKTFREEIRWSQSDFARDIGLTRDQLAGIEYGRTPLRYDLAIIICRMFDIKLKWLASGVGEIHHFEPIPWTGALRNKFNEKDLLSKVYDFNPRYFEPFRLPKSKASITPPPDYDFRDYIYHELRSHCDSIEFQDLNSAWIFAFEMSRFLRKKMDGYLTKGEARKIVPKRLVFARKNRLTKTSDFRNIASNMKLARTMKELLEDIRKVTEPAGMKAALAKHLGIPQARVSEWLAGKYEPSGEITLKLLHWVEQQERAK